MHTPFWILIPFSLSFFSVSGEGDFQMVLRLSDNTSFLGVFLGSPPPSPRFSALTLLHDLYDSAGGAWGTGDTTSPPSGNRDLADLAPGSVGPEEGMVCNLANISAASVGEVGSGGLSEVATNSRGVSHFRQTARLGLLV